MSEIENLAWKIYREEPVNEKLRPYYLKYLDEIKRFGKFDFLVANFRNFTVNNNTGLMLTLPELWEDFTVEDWIGLFESVGDRPTGIKIKEIDTGIFTDILFFGKYLELDGIDLALKHSDLSCENKLAIANYAKVFCEDFIKSPIDLESLDGTDEKELGYQPLGCTLTELLFIKNKLLIDSRIKEFPQNRMRVREYTKEIYSTVRQSRQTI